MTDAQDLLEFIRDLHPEVSYPPCELDREPVVVMDQSLWEAIVDDAKTVLARPAPQPVGVKVKPLVWEKDGKTHSAKTPFGEYRVASIHGEWMWLLAWMPTSVEDRIDKGIPRGKNSADSAKAAAQADYERRILSALDPQTARTFTEDEALAMVRAGWDQAAGIASNACLVPPDGGSPTEDEIAVCDEAYERIMASIPTDATAALARVTDAAEAKGRREALEEATDRLDKIISQFVYFSESARKKDQAFPDAIRALIEKEGQDDD